MDFSNKKKTAKNVQAGKDSVFNKALKTIQKESLVDLTVKVPSDIKNDFALEVMKAEAANFDKKKITIKTVVADLLQHYVDKQRAIRS